MADVLEEIFAHLRAIAARAKAAREAKDMAGVRAAIHDYGLLYDAAAEISGETRPVIVEGMTAEWVIPPAIEGGARLLYVHGGSWIGGGCSSHRALISRVAEAARCPALLFEYRLAPEHPFPAGLDDCVAAYDWLRANGPDGPGAASTLYLVGDSAGGNLALALMMRLRDEGKPLPDRAALLSPALDSTASGESAKTRADVDPVIDPGNTAGTFRAYTGGGDVTQPLVSPLFGEFHGLPPALFQVGDAETLRDDSVRAAEKARAAGVGATLEVWPEMPHVWHFFAPVLPQANEAIERIGAYLRETALRDA